jgi:hypothetical protein
MSVISFDWQGSGLQNAFFQAKQLTSTTTGSFCTIRDRKPTKNVWTNDITRLDDTPWHCASAHSYFGSWKTWLWDPTPLLAWSGPLRFLLVSKNKIAVTRAPFPGCTWNSGTITDHPACNFNFTQLRSASKHGRNTGPTAQTQNRGTTKNKGTCNYWISAAGYSGYTLIFSKNAHLTFTLTAPTAQSL